MVKKKDEFYEKFAEAFHDVVGPVLEDMQGDIKEIKNDIEDINRTLDRVVNRQVELNLTP